MLRTLFAFGLLACALSNPASAQDAKQDFVLVNQTGYDFSELYVSPSKSNNWQEDLLADDDDGFEDGTAKTIHFNPRAKTCLWDLKVVYEEDDSEAIWHDINLCEVSKVTLKYNRKSGDTTAFFD